MYQKHYILLIDTEPSSKELEDYFAKFDTIIKQQQVISISNIKNTPPIAILINCKFLEKKTDILNKFHNDFCVPILAINDTNDVETNLVMLNAGADYVLSRPINPNELQAYIQSTNRRIQSTSNNSKKENTTYIFQDWILSTASRQIFKIDYKFELHLSTGEYDLLLAFLQRPQQILRRDYLVKLNPNYNYSPLNRRIDVQISRLRQKLEINNHHPNLIKTIRNKGYMFMAPVIVK